MLLLLSCNSAFVAFSMQKTPQGTFELERLPADIQREVYKHFVGKPPALAQNPNILVRQGSNSATKRIADIRSFLLTRRKYYFDADFNQHIATLMVTAYGLDPIDAGLQLRTAGANEWLGRYLNKDMDHMNSGIGRFLTAISNAQLRTFRSFIKAGLSAQTTDAESNSPLIMLAQAPASTRHQKIAVWLLQNGANPNVNIKQTYPLLEGARNNNSELVLLLLQNGANPNIVGDDDSTPLLWAVSYNNIPMVIALLAKGITKEMINKKDIYNMSPLQTAKNKRCKDLEQLLIKYGAQK